MQFNLSLAKPSPNRISVAGEWLFSVNTETREKTMKRMKKKMKKKKNRKQKVCTATDQTSFFGGKFFLQKAVLAAVDPPGPFQNKLDPITSSNQQCFIYSNAAAL